MTEVIVDNQLAGFVDIRARPVFTTTHYQVYNKSKLALSVDNLGDEVVDCMIMLSGRLVS